MFANCRTYYGAMTLTFGLAGGPFVGTTTVLTRVETVTIKTS